MKTRELIQTLSRFHLILVIGPPRSGTRVGATIIGTETDRLMYDEPFWRGIERHRIFEFRERMIERAVELSEPERGFSSRVIQLPAFALLCHDERLAQSKNIAFVMMKRSVDDILESWDRFVDRRGITLSDNEKSWIDVWKRVYGREFDKLDLPTIMYEQWYVEQKPQIMNAFDIDYKSLSYHKLWIRKGKRLNHYYKGRWDGNSTAPGYHVGLAHFNRHGVLYITTEDGDVAAKTQANT